jgi:hypothetical protein
MNVIAKIILGTFCFLNSCKSQQNFKSEGFIILNVARYDSSTKQYSGEDLMPDLRIWHRGNFVIQEIKIIKTSTVDGNFKYETPLLYYLVMDRDKKMFYHYSSFSDTARLLDQYKLEDTSEMKAAGGWPFYKEINVEVIGPKKDLKDTVINDVLYKRVYFSIKNGDFISPSVYYLRCDKKGSLFRFDKKLSEEFGCPIVRIDHLPTAEKPAPISSELVFVRNKLTNEERRIFDAWEKKAKKTSNQ